PTGPYLTHTAADCPARAQVCLSTGMTFTLMDDKQHNFDPHPKDRPDKYSPITQAFPITITSSEPITGLQFEAVDEDCVRPWLSGMAGQEGSLLMQLFWGGQIEFNAPAVFPTEPESMDELPAQPEAALFAIAGVGSAHPPEKQLCISTIRATYGEETQTLVGQPVNCPFDTTRCTPHVSSKAETDLIPGRLAELYKKAAKLAPEDINAIARMQSGIKELLARVHPDNQRVVNQTIAKALLRQELGPFNKATAQPYTQILLDWAADAATQAEWAASAPAAQQSARQQVSEQAAAIRMAQLTDIDEDEEDGEDDSGDDYGLGFDLEQPALLDALQQGSNQQSASRGYDQPDDVAEPIDETSHLHPFSLDISRRSLLQLAPELDDSALNLEPGLFTSTSSEAGGMTSAENDNKLEAMMDSTLAAEGALVDPVPGVVGEGNGPPTAAPALTNTPEGVLVDTPGGLEQGIPSDTLGSLGTPVPPATLTAITPPAPRIKDDKTDASLGFDDAMATTSSDAQETDKQLSETFGSSAADMPAKDLLVNLPAAAPVDSKKPQEAHEAAMGATAKTNSSKQLAPGSHAAAPSTSAHPPSAASKSSSQLTGGLWGKAKNMFGMGGGSRSTAEEEELLEELAEEEEDADMMQAVIRSQTGSGSPSASKANKPGKQSQEEVDEMRERDELLREAEEETDVEDREGFNLGESILAATETGHVSPAPASGKNNTSGKTAPASKASTSGLFSTGAANKGSDSQLEMEREVERFEQQEAELEAEMAETRPSSSAKKAGQKGNKSNAAPPAPSSSNSAFSKSNASGKTLSQSSTSRQDAEDQLFQEASALESEDFPYLEEDVEIRAAEQKANAKQAASKGVAPSTARKLPPAGGQYTLENSSSGKPSTGGIKDALDELRDDLEEEAFEATDAGLPATGAGSALRQPPSTASQGKAVGAPTASVSTLLGGRKTGEGSQELLEDSDMGLFSEDSAGKSAASKGTLAFEEDEEALGLAGGSSSTPSKTGSSKLPEAFREDITGNDTMRSKASQGTLPGAAKTSNKTSETLAGKASDVLAGKSGVNTSAIKASVDKLADEAETSFDDLASGLGASSSSKSSKGLTGSPGSKAASASFSDADAMDEYGEQSIFAGSLGSSAKEAAGLSGKGITGFDGPESMAEMMDEQVNRTPGGTLVRDELAAPSKPSSQSTGQKINGLIFSPGSSTRNLIVVSILGAVAGAAAIHYYRILKVNPAQKRIVDLRHFGQPRRGASSYSRVSNPAAQTWDKDWNDDNWDDASERGFRQKPSR
ncbi:hypothetical protein WJX84_007225, partial [Apatococcus fuscideae]